MSLSFKTPKTALNVTTRDIQNIGSGDCPEINLESTSVEYTENGEYSVTPSEGFDGLSEVGITVNIDTQAIADEAYAEGEAAGRMQGYQDGYDAGEISGIETGIEEQKAKLTSLNVTSNGTYNKEDGYNSVTVNVPSDINNQNKTVSPTTSSQSVTADSGYSGLGTVTVEAVTSSIDANIAAGNIKKNVSILGVTGSYDPQPTLQSKTVDPATSIQGVQADAGYDGLSSVTVNAVTAAIDQNITASNIKEGVTILGVTGTVDPTPDLQAKNVTPTTSQQVIEADSPNYGLSSVTVAGVTSAIDANIQAGNIKSGITILGVTGTVTEGITPTGNINITNTNSTDVTNYATAQVVDANLTAGNIKSGTTILGVQGSYDPQPSLETGVFEIETVGATTFTPEEADGFDSVEITVPLGIMGSMALPFDNYNSALDSDYEEGYYYATITSGEYDERNNVYIAYEGDPDEYNHNIFYIKPYISDGGDPETFSFPDDFDLRDKLITVYYQKANATPILHPSKGVTIGIEITDCELSAINDNFNSGSWPFGILDVTTNGPVDPTGYEEINVDVQPNLQAVTATPTDRQQVITADREYDGLSEVTISGVTAAIDSNITASNIKSGVSILGVTGTYSPNLQSKSVSSSTLVSTITPSSGYDGMSSVTVSTSASSKGTASNPYISVADEGDLNTVVNPSYFTFTIPANTMINAPGTGQASPNAWFLGFPSNYTEFTNVGLDVFGTFPTGFQISVGDTIVVTSSPINSDGMATVQLYSYNGSTNSSDWIPTDCSVERQNGYDEGYSEGYEIGLSDGQNSCVCPPEMIGAQVNETITSNGVYNWIPTDFDDGVTSYNCITDVNITVDVPLPKGLFNQNATSTFTIEIPDGISTIRPYCFYGCPGLTSVDWGGNTISSIGKFAFELCTGLTGIELPSSISRIYEGTFRGCTGLTNITIPSNVTNIESFAFYGCSGLQSMTFESTTPATLGTTSLGQTSYAFPIYVPSSAVSAYQTVWSDYASRIQANPNE